VPAGRKASPDLIAGAFDRRTALAREGARKQD
jgi:hypothetical protein